MAANERIVASRSVFSGMCNICPALILYFFHKMMNYRHGNIHCLRLELRYDILNHSNLIIRILKIRSSRRIVYQDYFSIFSVYLQKIAEFFLEALKNEW